MYHILCRDCLTLTDGDCASEACAGCGGKRLFAHAEMADLTIAHVDCDAFFATVEKRDRPDLADKPVAVGGGSGRGVLTTACYVARQYGLRSAMPGFKARQLCPDVVFIKPNMEKYKAASDAIRAIFARYTSMIQPLSVDEAYLDLSAACRKDQRPPALLMAELARAVEKEVGVTVSVGLAPNKFLAKLASDLDKPRGMAGIGPCEARARLAPMPVRRIMGVGPATEGKLHQAGFHTIGDLQQVPESLLVNRFGRYGYRLAQYRFGLDDRPVRTSRTIKSISAETTLERNTANPDELMAHIERIAGRLEGRISAKGMAGMNVFLKLKSADFQITTRQMGVESPVQTAANLLTHARALLPKAQQPGTWYRLVGLGISHLVPASSAAPAPRRNRLAEEQQTLDLFDD